MQTELITFPLVIIILGFGRSSSVNDIAYKTVGGIENLWSLPVVMASACKFQITFLVNSE